MSNVIDLNKFRDKKNEDNKTHGFGSEMHSYSVIHPSSEKLTSEIIDTMVCVMVRECIPTNHPNIIVIKNLLEEMFDVKLKIRDEQISSNLSSYNNFSKNSFNPENYSTIIDELITGSHNFWSNFSNDLFDDKK